MENINYQATPEVKAVIDSIGRTEDVKCSPNGRYLALVENRRNKIHFFEIRIEEEGKSPVVYLINCITISSESLNYPHGLAFLGNDYFVVANRGADVAVFKFPADLSIQSQSEVVLTPVVIAKGQDFYGKISSPGNVACYQIKNNYYRVLVCNNFINTIISLDIFISDKIRIKNNGVLIKRGLKLPDGVGVSPDQKWVAVSNHDGGAILIYRLSPFLNRFTAPSVVLEGIACPHGIRFSADGRKIFVADAGSQFIHIYESNNENWHKALKSIKVVKMVDKVIFDKSRIKSQGKINAEEGGLKGIDILNDGILFSTAENQVLNMHLINELVDVSIVPQEQTLLRNQLEEIRLFRKAREQHAWAHRVTLESKIKILIKKLITWK